MGARTETGKPETGKPETGKPETGSKPAGTEDGPPDEVGVASGGQALRLVKGEAVRLLSAELLRIYSPSAEVRGHGSLAQLRISGQPVADRRPLAPDTGIVGIELVGYYGLQIAFSDGHDSGIFSWEYLRRLYDSRVALMRRYRAGE